jgi:RNA polymerase sigma-70 factor (ECF subfamily)
MKPLETPGFLFQYPISQPERGRRNGTLKIHLNRERVVSLDHPDFPSRVRDRDSNALEAVVRAYLPQVVRAARGAGLDQFEGRSHVRTWIFGILYKKIAETRRRLSRDRDVDDLDEVFEQRFDTDGSWTRPPRPVDSDAYAAEIREGIAGCLEDVPTKPRVAFVLREVQGLETEEICKILEVTRTNLRVLLHRVRNRLRECLESKVIEG